MSGRCSEHRHRRFDSNHDEAAATSIAVSIETNKKDFTVKYAITLFAGYYAPAILNHINIDICLGIAAGVLFGLLVAMLFIGPTPALAPQPVTPRVNKTVRKPRKIIERPVKVQYGLSISNYTPTEWGIA